MLPGAFWRSASLAPQELSQKVIQPGAQSVWCPAGAQSSALGSRQNHNKKITAQVKENNSVRVRARVHTHKTPSESQER